MIPSLSTARLRLRPPRADDFADYAAFCASPRTAGMGGPLGTRQAWGMFCHEAAGWALFGVGALMLERHEDEACLGLVGISNGPRFPEAELGWLLYEGHEGKGYGREAAAALRDWAAETRGLTRLVSYVDPENARSIALALRLGAVLDPEAKPQDPEDLVFRHRPGA